MTGPLAPLQEGLVDLDGFTDLGHYRLFGTEFLRYVAAEEPTVIYSPSDDRYRFYQFSEQYGREITRPLNFDLWIADPERFAAAFDRMTEALRDAGRAGGIQRAASARGPSLRRYRP